ncbi:uncharacterized protein [Phyllobates terribilis]|uniref:uncharacterized protein isoform X1 n=1 Tax=Phyllobates terribilis TaxID=111132 RepID=UPI003CCB2AE3
MEVSIRLSKEEKGVSIGIKIKGIQMFNIAQDEVKNPSSSEAILTNPPAKKKKKKSKKKKRTKEVVIEQFTEQVETIMGQNNEQVEVMKDPSTETEIVIPVRLSTEEERPKEAAKEPSTGKVETTMDQTNEHIEVINVPLTKKEVVLPVHLSTEEEGPKEAAKEPSTGKVETTMDQTNEHIEVINVPLTKKEVVVSVRLSTEEDGSEKVVMEPSSKEVEITMEQSNGQVDVIKDPPPKTEIDVPVRVSIEEEGVSIDIKIKGIHHVNFTHPPVNNPSPSKEILTNPVDHPSSKKKKRRTKKVVMKPSTGQVEAKLDENNDQVGVIKKEMDVPVHLSTEEQGFSIDKSKKGRQSCNFAQDPKKKTSNSKETLPNPTCLLPEKKKKKKKKTGTKQIVQVSPDDQVEETPTKTVWLKMFKRALIGLFLSLVMYHYFETPILTMIGDIYFRLGHFNTYIKTLQDLKKNCQMIYKFLKDNLFPKKDGEIITPKRM